MRSKAREHNEATPKTLSTERIRKVVAHLKDYERLWKEMRSSRPLSQKFLNLLLRKEPTFGEGVVRPPSARRHVSPSVLLRIEF